METLRIINLVLLLVIALLAINLIAPLNDMTGKVVYSLDPAAPSCTFMHEVTRAPLTAEQCCPALEAQLSCDPIGDQGFICSVRKGSTTYYLANHKMIGYCRSNGYRI